jgi:hypothetical protein
MAGIREIDKALFSDKEYIISYPVIQESIGRRV